MRKIAVKILTMTLCVMMLFTLSIRNIEAKTRSGYYDAEASIYKTFKIKRRKLYVRTEKNTHIDFYKKNRYKGGKNAGNHMVIKLSKKCKYYQTSIDDKCKRIYDPKYMNKVSFSKIAATIKDIRQSRMWCCGITFVVKKGYVTKIMMVYS
ncbi:hypothetical protein SAMN05216520_10533 [Kandleria vitulina]|uniref:hypothetical protein n=1 Tax=Kandleria vitulina TaxID=1630 RepID=UPI0008872F71|nr:hypothetical protein [Kandleria vitulina]SDL40023.1 hypothetical protein SAMN05216520_10533 [Kandleria vitulina]